MSISAKTLRTAASGYIFITGIEIYTSEGERCDSVMPFLMMLNLGGNGFIYIYKKNMLSKFQPNAISTDFGVGRFFSWHDVGDICKLLTAHKLSCIYCKNNVVVLPWFSPSYNISFY